MHAALDLLLAQEREPAFDEIEPRRAGRCEVDMKTCVARESPPHARRFVRAVVIEDQMHLEVRRDADVNRLQELQELLTPMPSMTLAKDLERPLAELDLFAPRRWQLG
jgi:hypothetical protein